MMGKTQRFSKGYSSGFVPDYRHAVETVGETEGFGSSVRVDSEDSSAPKRKCISLNTERHGRFNIPLQVISFSKLSGSEKKGLEMRLKEELEQVQMLRKKILTRNTIGSSSVALSSSSNVPSKKQGSIGQNGSNVKRGNSGRFESAKYPPAQPPSNSYASLMKDCKGLLDRLLTHQYAWIFNHPVDVVKLNIPDYFQVIKQPMDLGTIKNRIASSSYSPSDFVSDVRLTFANAMTYNPPSNDVHIMAKMMSKFFEDKWKPIAKKLAAVDATSKKEVEERKTVLQPKKRKASPRHDVIQPEVIKPKVTIEEKFILSKRLEALALTDMPPLFLDFFKSQNPNLKQSEDEIEVDIDALSDDALIELKNLLDDYSMGIQSGPEQKDEPCDMEILNDSGLSNLSMNHCIGNEQADEDVDIVGNDPPISSYPPVVIEKDAFVTSGKCSSSSSSSSDSGSSSDSDSGSSSESEADVKVVSPKNDTKENMQLVERLDHEKSNTLNQVNGISELPGSDPGSSSILDQRAQDAYAKSESSEADCRREGGNAPIERQASPEKRYRAALLRSRFADTILKAREKTLDQEEKKDPEKLQRDREELERQKREEKARLQAEAKAAEDARRQAEAAAAEQAAAEAKRIRELEREKARQALQQMEKTVDLVSSLNPQDLEILRTGQGEHLLSSVGETSPAHSQEGVGGIRLVGSISLQQFGLSLIPDGEDEEEYELNSAPVNDVEEGEVD